MKMKIAYAENARQAITRYFGNTGYKPFYFFITTLAKDGLEGFTRNPNVKKYDYSNDGYWIVRYGQYRLVCTITSNSESGDVLIVVDILDRGAV